MVKPHERLIERADREVSLFDVLEQYLGIYHPREGKSYKDYCPWGHSHPDGGVEKSWRTYPQTNTSYCFNGCGLITPSRVVAMALDLSRKDAARRLLHEAGLLSKPWRERWQELALDKERYEETNIALVAEALRKHAQGHPRWRDEDERCERVLDSVLARLDEIIGLEKHLFGHWFEEVKAQLMERLDGLGADSLSREES